MRMASNGRFATPEGLIFILLMLLILGLFRSRAFNDPGSLWHVRVGEIILTEGFPWTDPFTYTHADRLWIPQQWLGEVGMRLAYGLSGFDGLLLGMAVLIAGLWTLIFSRLLVAGMGWPLAAAVTALSLFVSSYHFYVRPHMATMVFLGWTVASVVDFDRDRASLWRIAGLIPVFVLWTNIHGGVLGGIVTLLVAVAGWIGMGLFCRGRGWTRVSSLARSTTPREALLLVGIAGACVLAPLVNPFGLEMLRTWQRIVGSEVLPKIVIEHRPLDPTSATGAAVLLLAGFYLLLLGGALLRTPQEFRLTWLIPMLWLVMTLQGIRQGPLFAIVTAIVIADLWPATIWYGWLRSHGDWLAVEPALEPRRTVPGLTTWVLAVLSVLVCVAVQTAGFPLPLVGAGWAKLDERWIPLDLTPVIHQTLQQAGPSARFFNDANLGGYFIFFHPDQKIFMDDRCELYGDRWLADYAAVVHERPQDFERWDQQYKFAWAILQSDPKQPTALERYLSHSSRWRSLPEGIGQGARLFVRNSESGLE